MASRCSVMWKGCKLFRKNHSYNFKKLLSLNNGASCKLNFLPVNSGDFKNFFSTTSKQQKVVVEKLNYDEIDNFPKISSLHPAHFYQNTENENAEAFFKSSPLYKNTLYSPKSQQLTNPIAQRFVQAAASVRELENYEDKKSIISPEFADIVNQVLNNLSSFNDQDLSQVFYSINHFAPCSSVHEPDYVRIWSQLDAECVRRFGKWDMDFLFVICDLFDGLRLVRFSEFHKKVVRKCLDRCDLLKKEHFIRLMYLLNLSRHLPDRMAAYDIESYLRKYAECFNYQEVSIIAMAFFKTETVLRDDQLLETLLNVAIQNKEKLNSVNTSSIAKFARYRSNMRKRNILYKLQEAFCSEIYRLSISSCTHLTLVGTNIQYPYMPLINGVIAKIGNQIQEARLKELERLALSMTHFDADCDHFAKLLVQELRDPRRAQEINEYGRSLPAILHYLSMREIFPHDVINKVLGIQFRQTFYGINSENYQRELFCLDFCVGLEIPDYKGERLEAETRDRILKAHVSRVIRETRQKIPLHEVNLAKAVKMLEPLVGGSEYLYSANIFPHHKTLQIVLCTDKNGRIVKVPLAYRNIANHEIKFLPNDCKNVVFFHILYFCNKNDFIESENRLTGIGKLKVRQLKKMGYSVQVMFPPYNHKNINEALQKSLIPKKA